MQEGFLHMFKFSVSIIQVSFEKLKSNHNQTWVKDSVGVPSYANEVKIHEFLNDIDLQVS